jgi:hypothetical protein
MEKTVYVRNEADFWVCEAGADKGETLTLTQFYGKYPFPKTHEYYAPAPDVLEVYLRGTYKERPTAGKTAKASKATPKAPPKAPETKSVATTPPGRYYDVAPTGQGTLF